MQLSLPTIAICAAALTSALAVLVWLCAPQERGTHDPAPRLWAAALLAAGCGWIAVVLQHAGPSALPLAAGCALILLAFALFGSGIHVAKAPSRHPAVTLSVALAGGTAGIVAAIVTSSAPALVARIFALTLLALMLAQAWPLGGALRRGGNAMQRALLAVSALVAAAALRLAFEPAPLLLHAVGSGAAADAALLVIALAPGVLSIGFVQLRAARDMHHHRPLAHIDPLTGALNRRAIVHHSRQLFATSLRHGRGLALLMLQIDHFERLQALLGRSCEQHILPPAYACLRDVLRAEDIIGRSSRDTFVLLLPESDPAGAADAAERLREALTLMHLRAPRRMLRITASIGVATMLPGDRDLQPMLRRAERALAAARRAGCNRVSTHAPRFRNMDGNVPPSLPGRETRP